MSAFFSPLSLFEIASVEKNPPLSGQLKNLPLPHKHVCIIGAGVSGLYAALILDSLAIPGLTYDILEGSDRVGGRIYTHYFSKRPHDYADMGAMRYPQTPEMLRTFHLMDVLQIPLLNFRLQTASQPAYSNSVLSTRGDISWWHSKGSGDMFVGHEPSEILDACFAPWGTLLQTNFNTAFLELLAFDRYSVRQYLTEKVGLDERTIGWLESMESAKGLFDESFAEAVLDWFHIGCTTSWAAIDGGSSVLIDRMLNSVRVKPELKQEVRAIKQTDRGLEVRINGQPSRSYDVVLCSAPLPCLRSMDLNELGLLPKQRQAIDELHYDDSVKVAIKFDHPWWKTKCGIQHPGTATTDLPLRTCVYPFHDCPESESAVLLCSYTWADDARYLSKFVDVHSPRREEKLVDLLIHSLAQLHAPMITEKQIRDSYVTHYAFDWAQNAFSQHAFALCSPGQLTQIWPSLLLPAADGRFIFMGEAASKHRGWVAGALNSVYRAVHQMLPTMGHEDKRQTLSELWRLSATCMQ